MDEGLLSPVTYHPSQERRPSPTKHLPYISLPPLDDFNFMVYNCWEEVHGYSPPSPWELRSLFPVKKNKKNPPCPTVHGKEHLCNGFWNCGCVPRPTGPRPTYLDLWVVWMSLWAVSLLFCLSIDKILQSKMNLLIRLRTYGAPKAVNICGRMENSLSTAGILRFYQV